MPEPTPGTDLRDPDEPTGRRILERHVPDPSQANDTYVGVTAVASALLAIGFAVTLRLGAPIGLYSGLLALSLFSLGLAVRRYFYDRF
uniref:hypothetical protein n=1 Tax=Marinobacter mobilis TaxID=488533 RepID=UPI0035C6A344